MRGLSCSYLSSSSKNTYKNRESLLQLESPSKPGTPLFLFSTISPQWPAPKDPISLRPKPPKRKLPIPPLTSLASHWKKSPLSPRSPQLLCSSYVPSGRQRAAHLRAISKATQKIMINNPSKLSPPGGGVSTTTLYYYLFMYLHGYLFMYLSYTLHSYLFHTYSCIVISVHLILQFSTLHQFQLLIHYKLPSSFSFSPSNSFILIFTFKLFTHVLSIFPTWKFFTFHLC